MKISKKLQLHDRRVVASTACRGRESRLIPHAYRQAESGECLRVADGRGWCDASNSAGPVVRSTRIVMDVAAEMQTWRGLDSEGVEFDQFTSNGTAVSLCLAANDNIVRGIAA